MAPGPTTITLEIDVSSPLEGSVGLAGGPAQPFHGWVGLLAALGALVDPGPAPCQPPSPLEAP